MGIIAYDSKPTNFRKFIDLQVLNGRPVAFCNDGSVGQTFMHAVSDVRMPDWLRDALPTGLPPGDSLLVVDVDLNVTAVEVATAVPRQALRLIAAVSVVAENSPSARTSAALKSIAAATASAERAQGLAALASLPKDTLQRLRIEHLQRLDNDGYPSEDWWRVVGRDCIIPGRPDLRMLEASLASTCLDELNKHLSSPAALIGDTPAALLGYLVECKTRAASASAVRVSDSPITVDPRPAILDRDTESREVHHFLDDTSLDLLEILGLQQIGKSAVLAKALAESGISRVLRIPLTETSSAEYIVQAIRPADSPAARTEPADPIAMLREPAASAVLKNTQVLVLERAHLLLNRGSWRDDLMPKVLDTLVDAARQARCKVIFESRRQLPLVFGVPASRKPLRVYGLDRLRNPYGVSLFDAQLRRVDLSPNVLSAEEKALLVTKLGGHPVAIALAADAAFEGGARSLLNALRSHKGFFLNFVSRLIRSLELSDFDKVLLQMLSLARTGVPREALLQASGFPATELLRDLISMGAVEVTTDDLIEIAGVLREYFDPEQLTSDQRAAFHKSAAQAYAALVKERSENLAAGVEAEYHAGVIGASIPASAASRLVDGALGSAFRLYNSGEYERASVIVERLLQGRQTVDILRLAARTEAYRNNFDAALRYARAAFSRNPRDTDLLADLAKIALNQYRDDVAEGMISIARSAGVEAVAILIVEGRMLLRRAEFIGAEQAFRRAIELTTNNSWPFYFLGASYIQSGRLEDALEVLEAGERFFYESQSRSRRALMAIRTKLAVIHLLLGRDDLAAPMVDALVQEDPDNPEVLRVQAALIIAKEGVQQAAKALELLTKARVKTRRDRAQLHLFTGIFFLRMDDRHGAAEEFRKGLDADSGNVYLMMKLARTLFDLAVIAWRHSDPSYRAFLDECRSVTRRILRFDPDNPEGVALIADVASMFKVDV